MAKPLFKIVDLDEEFDNRVYEHLGTKRKFWFNYPEDPDKYLFKFSRANTGEHWSEKVAEQICCFLGIPHAEYELAIFKNSSEAEPKWGIISKNIVPKSYAMSMGNEVLYNPNEPFPKEGAGRVKEHTVDNVRNYIKNFKIEPPIGWLNKEIDTWGVFCGYLMLDVLISNQDRHHENWAILNNQETGVKYLAPTYDHAASLGRELTDVERRDRLSSNDKNRKVGNFVKRARSALFEHCDCKKPLTTIDAFKLATKNDRNVFDFWTSKLDESFVLFVKDTFDRIDREIISSDARCFAVEMIMENKKRLTNE